MMNSSRSFGPTGNLQNVILMNMLQAQLMTNMETCPTDDFANPFGDQVLIFVLFCQKSSKNVNYFRRLKKLFRGQILYKSLASAKKTAS